MKSQFRFGGSLSREEREDLVEQMRKNIVFPVMDPFDPNYIPSRNY